MSRTESTRVAIIGGGKACHELLSMIGSRDSGSFGLIIQGVADPNPESPCIHLARELGVPLLVQDYHVFFSRDDIDLVVELTGDHEIRDAIIQDLPRHMHFIGHRAAGFFWELFAADRERESIRRKAEAQVREERNRLRTILDSLPYEILVISGDYEVEFANRTYLESNAAKLDEIVGQFCYDLEHKTKGPCSVRMNECPHADALREGRSISTVVSRVDETGREVFTAVRAAPIRSDDGEILGVVEAIRDITHRVETEKELKHTRSRLNQFIDTAPLFVYMKDQNLRYRVVNRYALEKMGLNEIDVLGKTDFDLFPEALAQKFHARDRKVLMSGKTAREKGEFPIPNGTMYTNSTVFPVRAGNTVVGLFAFVEDITELHDSELALVRQKEQLSETQMVLQRLLENSRDMIFITDLSGRILSVNLGAQEVLGISESQIVGRHLHDFCVETEACENLIQCAVKDRHVNRFEVEFVGKGKEEHTICNVSLTTISGPDGEPVEMLAICRDITTRLRLQDDLIRAERLAALGRMASGVAHEINNPLAVIDTIGGLIRETLEDEKDNLHASTVAVLSRAVDRLQFQVKRASTITHNLLGFARKSATSGMETVNLEALIDETVELLAVELEHAAVRVERADMAHIPTLYTDPMALQQVFVNLIKNAIDAVEEAQSNQELPPEGRIQIRAEPHQDQIRIHVQDNGAGIPPDKMERIFDLFFTSKPAGKGTGLGLSVVHNIMKKLGGTIRAKSEPGQGTTFTVELPVQPNALQASVGGVDGTD